MVSCRFFAKVIIILTGILPIRILAGETEGIFWPVDKNWGLMGKVVSGPKDLAGKVLGELPKVVEFKEGILHILPGAPGGQYTIEWVVPVPADTKGAEISFRFFKANDNQYCYMQAWGDERFKDWIPLDCGRTGPAWYTLDDFIWPIEDRGDKKIHLLWQFSKPGEDSNWIVKLVDLRLKTVAADKARTQVLRPVVKGLPPVADPTAVRPWTGKIEIRDGIILKDGNPFFPVGYNYGLSERHLAQVVAMGCTAVHFPSLWSHCPRPGMVDAGCLKEEVELVRRSGEWGLAVSVVPIYHTYAIPGWYSKDHPMDKTLPRTNEGKTFSSFQPSSFHYPPMREHLANYWRSLAPVLVREANLLDIGMWNEPSYGGYWCCPSLYCDYSEWAVDRYRKYLKTKYGTVGALRKVHGRNYESFEKVEPPKGPDDMGRVVWLEWMEFGQEAFAGFFDFERGVLKSAAPNARVTNKKIMSPWDCSAGASGYNWELMNRSEDIFGLDNYINSDFGTRNIFDACRSYARGKPVVVYETNTNPNSAAARPADRVRVGLWAQVLGGARGAYIFMFGDGNCDGHGLLNDADVSPDVRPEYVRFSRDISTHQRELASPHVPARIAVLYSNTAALQNPGTSLIPNHVEGAYNFFRNAHFQADILPEERCTAEGLKEYELVVLPSHSILKKPGLAALAEFLERGGKLMAFANSLATDEYLRPVPPPSFLGIDRREKLGDKTEQKVWKMIDPAIQSYLEGEVGVSGLELFSKITNADKKIVQGQAIETKQEGKVLASCKDFPAVVQSPRGNVIYCAFETSYSDPLCRLIEGITRECLGIKQNVRLLNDGLVEPGVMTSLRQDYKDPKLRYLMVINTLRRPRILRPEMEKGWKIDKELFHSPHTAVLENGTAVKLAAHEVYLFKLVKIE